MGELLVRMVVSLAVVVGLLILLSRVAARRFQGRSGSTIEVLHRQAKKAEKYKKLKAHMRDIELHSASHRFLELMAEHHRGAVEMAQVELQDGADPGALALALGAGLVAAPPLLLLVLAGGERAAKCLLWWPFLGTQAAALPWPSLFPGPMRSGAESAP